MIVLDEQLLGRRIEVEIKTWYRGRVCFITDLRPGTVIKDEAIPGLLRQHRGAIFVTINASDFWRRTPADPRYCVVCLVLADSRARKVPEFLRSLLRTPPLRTNAVRSGKVLRVSGTELRFHSRRDSRVQTAPRQEQ